MDKTADRNSLESGNFCPLFRMADGELAVEHLCGELPKIQRISDIGRLARERRTAA